MPSYLDFDSTNQFRNSILSRTLQQPNGPQTFTNSSYSVGNLNDFSNVDPGNVDTNLPTFLSIPDTRNTFTTDIFEKVENLRDLTRLQDLGLYPYFTQGSYNNFISIMTTDNYDQESNLMKFAARHIRENEQGPVLARITQNLVSATYCRVRLLDALEGNTATAINLITGRENLVEKNYKITVASTLPGKAIDFLQTVAGVEFPWSEIPGDYLTNPANPINYRPEAQTTAGQIIQDVTGVLGSLIGIQRRPKLSSKPSDLMIEYMGSGQKDVLFDNLRFSKYAPNYSKSARSQQSSKLFNFVNQIGDAINDVLGAGAPTQGAYIGDDRGDDVKYAMGDFNDNIVRSSYYLGLMFDPVQTELFERQIPITQGGPISGKLTWYSRNSKNKLGDGNAEYNTERSQLEESLSTRYGFRSDSILGKTQELLNSMPSDGGAARSHVANAIDQTSRIFREGNVMLSRGSAIKYVDKYGQESGVEYCRVWTKDDPYMNMSDTMKRTGNIRKFQSSVMTTPWNLNIAPMSNGQGSFEGSTNMVRSGDGYMAKKYMFSLENLAWKTSTLPGFTYTDLPFCERGPNGGRIMWFPPYDIKVSEQNNARWETNTFLGRPEPIYTYQQTERTGQISFKVVVDHPSILNLLVQKVFKGMGEEESDNYINAFFAGCEEVDFYSLIRTYTTLTRDDIENIQKYLEGDKPDEDQIIKYKVVTEDVEQEVPDTSSIPQEPEPETVFDLYFRNDEPKAGSSLVKSSTTYTEEYGNYVSNSGSTTNPEDKTYMKDLVSGLDSLFSGDRTAAKKNDIKNVFGRDDVSGTTEDYDLIKGKIETAFNKLSTEFTAYNNKLNELKERIRKKEIKDLTIKIFTTTSSVAGDDYNLKLSLRRSHSLYKDILNKIELKDVPDDKFRTTIPPDGTPKIGQVLSYPFKDLGYEDVDGNLTIVYVGYGENATTNESIFGGGSVNVDCHAQDILTTPALKKTAPITFYCRHANVTFVVTPADKQPEEFIPDIPKSKLTPDGVIEPPKVQKPPIDEMKKIIMKTLSECYYFKVMEEDSPITFKSLTEKLKYFHPAFHSTTPEGLNARLTFLLQCVRPGDTIPLKGIADLNDVNARNTSFGPPPICVVRIGDFYHSKVVVRDVNITYDDGLWDLNPEGIGVQPMIANVTMQVNFIGGQGLEKPVERLQNALSSNFFANTEMYDPRSVSTDGSVKEEFDKLFSKEFLEKLQTAGNDSTTPNPINLDENIIEQGIYIGGSGETLSYGTLVQNLNTNVQSYFENFVGAYNNVLTNFGPQAHSIVFSPNYRSINDYLINTSNSSTRTIKMFGEFDGINGFDNHLTQFKVKLIAAIESEDVSTMMEFKFLSDDKIERSNEILKEKLTNLVSDKIDELLTYESIKSLSKVRNEIIKDLDKLNYVTKYVSDGKVDSGVGTQANLSGFTYLSLYEEYEHVADYFDKNSDKFEEKIDTSFTLNSQSIDVDTLSEILSVLLFGKEQEIKDIYNEDVILYPENIKNKINRKVDNFFEETREERIKLSRFKPKKNGSDLSFVVTDTEVITDQTQLDELNNVHSSKGSLGSTLNYFKP